MNKKIGSFLLAGVMALGLVACSAPNEGTGSSGEAGKSGSTGDKVRISILNSKAEIQPQMEKMAEEYGKKHNIEFEILVTGVDSPSQEISRRYASGEAPTLFMGDVQDIYMLEEKTLDLSNEKWTEISGAKEYGVVNDNGQVIAFPFCIEARGLMYNKTAIEKVTGEKFDPESVNTMDQLAEILEKLVAGGMESPVALNKEDWSLGGHYLCSVYEQVGKDVEDASKFIDELKAGKANLAENTRYNSLMDTFDLLAKYNMNKEDPMAADYDRNAIALAEGEVGFWFNGNWAWAEMKDAASDKFEYGVMPIPQNNTENGVADKLTGSASKRIMIDKEFSTEAQQKAALEWLNWLVYDEEGQKFIVDECQLVPAFSNNTLEVTNPLSASVQKYAQNNALIDGYPFYPGDHWKEMGAEFQKYLAGNTDRNEFAKAIEAYWQKQK